MEDLALARGESGGVDGPAVAGGLDQQGMVPERPQRGRRCGAPLFDGGVGGELAAVGALDQVVQGQRDHHQEHQ